MDLLNSVENEVINEESLTKGIFDLRKWLNEKELTQVEITTIRNIGYRLKINTSQVENTSSTNLIAKYLLKSVFYLFLIITFLILVIAAVKYEN